MDIQRLRQETEADHHNIEGAVPLMHQGLNTAEYVQCLQRIYGVVAAWEERAAEVAPEWLQPALHLSEGRGNSYFRGHCSQTGPLWKEFCEMLKLRIPDKETDAVVVSAKAMFSTFGT